MLKWDGRALVQLVWEVGGGPGTGADPCGQGQLYALYLALHMSSTGGPAVGGSDHSAISSPALPLFLIDFVLSLLLIAFIGLFVYRRYTRSTWA